VAAGGENRVGSGRAVDFSMAVTGFMAMAGGMGRFGGYLEYWLIGKTRVGRAASAIILRNDSGIGALRIVGPLGVRSPMLFTGVKFLTFCYDVGFRLGIKNFCLRIRISWRH